MKYWTHSITLVENCSKVSEGCKNCWSETIAHRFQPNQTDPLGNWTGKIICREDRLPELLKGKKPRVIQIWNDLFHNQVPDIFIQAAYLAMLATKKHTFLILTKRHERMARIIKINTEHIWHGVTVENQQRLNERLPYILQVPGKRWLSLEPLLSDINFRDTFWVMNLAFSKKEINQVIVGCETGKDARPCKIIWLESVVRQCREAGVPCFVKAINLNGKITSDITKFPESLRVRNLAWKGV